MRNFNEFNKIILYTQKYETHDYNQLMNLVFFQVQHVYQDDKNNQKDT